MSFSPRQLIASLVIAGITLFSALTPVAHAGSWGTPSYTVSDRDCDTPDGPAGACSDTNTNAPGGGAGGGTQLAANGTVVISGSGQKVAGTVKATFAWVATNGDTPPNDVYVLEYGSASCGRAVRNAGGGGGPQGNVISPSVEQAVYGRGRRPHLIQVQVGASNAIVDNGWGDEPQGSANGVSVTSQGYHVALYHPNPQKQLVTELRVLNAHFITRPQSPTCQWGYNAQVLNLAMTDNGQDITSPKPGPNLRCPLRWAGRTPSPSLLRLQREPLLSPTHSGCCPPNI